MIWAIHPQRNNRGAKLGSGHKWRTVHYSVKRLPQIKAVTLCYFCLQQINEILKKSEEQRSTDETELLQQSQDIVKDIEKRAKVRDLSKQRKLEVSHVILCILHVYLILKYLGVGRGGTSSYSHSIMIRQVLLCRNMYFIIYHVNIGVAFFLQEMYIVLILWLFYYVLCFKTWTWCGLNLDL